MTGNCCSVDIRMLRGIPIPVAISIGTNRTSVERKQQENHKKEKQMFWALIGSKLPMPSISTFKMVSIFGVVLLGEIGRNGA